MRKREIEGKRGRERLTMIAATLVVFVNYLETDQVFALSWGLP